MATTPKTTTPAKAAGKRKAGQAAKAEPKPKAAQAATKTRTKAEPKPSRYLRSARAIIRAAKPLSHQELAERANISVASAPYCGEAFHDVALAISEAGWVTREGMTALAALRFRPPEKALEALRPGAEKASTAPA